MRRVAIVTLGREAGMGEGRRVASWSAILRAGGVEVGTVHLLHEARGLPGVLGLPVPEGAAWSVGKAVEGLRRFGPDAVVAITTRAFHPRLAEAGAPVLLDFVDRLSVSYADRAAVATAPHTRFGFRFLAAAHRRAEARLRGPGTAAAGWADAESLGATWVPNTLEPVEPIDSAGADVDVVFFGNLSYAPNVAAVARLARVWPEVVRRRPGTTALIAGARPVPSVTAAAAQHGWEVAADFADLRAVLGRARLAVAPLVHTAGIQNKVLEAAALGVPQVVSAEAAAGLDPAFPVTAASDDDELVEAIVALLDDHDRRAVEGAAAAEHMATTYAPAVWAPRVVELLSGLPAPGRR